MKRKCWIVFGGAALGAAAAGLGRAGGHDGKALTAPFCLAGEGLRALSLSGFWGNLASWLIVLLVCALPLVCLAWLHRRGLERGREDWLLVLVSPVLFAMLWFLVNPTWLGGAAGNSTLDGMMAEMTARFFPGAAMGTVLSIVVAWLVIRLLREMEAAPTEKLARAFRLLLVGSGALAAFGAAFGNLAALLDQCAAVLEGNSVITGNVRLTLWVLALGAVMELIPGLMAAMTLLWGADLAEIMGTSAFSQNSLELCAVTAERCRQVVWVTALLAVCANLLQLVLLNQLHQTSFSVEVPLLTLALSVALFLLCRCLQRGKELQEDSESII